MNWTEEAGCRTYPKTVFYPDIVDDDGVEWFDDGTCWEAFGDTSPFYEQARTICNACPVKTECLAHALQEKERYGMWGGLTPIERRRIERTERRQKLKKRRAAEKQQLCQTSN